jgi:hypothetical protein
MGQIIDPFESESGAFYGTITGALRKLLAPMFLSRKTVATNELRNKIGEHCDQAVFRIRIGSVWIRPNPALQKNAD